jgi:hypothetical protein
MLACLPCLPCVLAYILLCMALMLSRHGRPGVTSHTSPSIDHIATAADSVFGMLQPHLVLLVFL